MRWNNGIELDIEDALELAVTKLRAKRVVNPDAVDSGEQERWEWQSSVGVRERATSYELARYGAELTLAEREKRRAPAFWSESFAALVLGIKDTSLPLRALQVARERLDAGASAVDIRRAASAWCDVDLLDSRDKPDYLPPK